METVPDLRPSQETIDFLHRHLPNYKGSERISEMLRSRTEGFFNKEKYPVPEDFSCSKIMSQVSEKS